MEDFEADRRNYTAPYTSNHPIPSIQRYRETVEERKNVAAREGDEVSQFHEEEHAAQRRKTESNGDEQKSSSNEDLKDTSEVQYADTKSKRKSLKKRNDRIERVVTDPVTHLPVQIHDFTSKALQDIEKNAPTYGSEPTTATGLANKNKKAQELKDELKQIAQGKEILESNFPPPSYQLVHQELVKTCMQGIAIAIAFTVILHSASPFLQRLLPDLSPVVLQAITSSLIVVITIPAIVVLRGWTSRRLQSIWDGAIWHSKFEKIEKDSHKHGEETTIWLNSLLAAVWPLINPELFTSLADTLEDVMQASLPSVVRMVSVDDIGQGSESLRILGVRWLPTAAAGRAVNADGDLETGDDEENHETSSHTKDAEKQSEESSASAMEAEEGDFINLEIAFAYKASSSGHTFKDRMKDMHLGLSFYLPGNLKLPIWVDLRGAIGIMRLRLQLAPDPPFFGLSTITLLGQPKIEISCVPVLKRGLNIMNLPLVNNFVQSSIDAAMAEYVAPKSLTLNLKDMISGDDFKKDVTAFGVLVVTIIRGYEFKIGDVGIPLIKDGSADPYVTVGWAKFGKPLWSSRILENEMSPTWFETTYALITPDEYNVNERLRLQLWDSDRFTADDDLGRIEVDIKELMNQEAKMYDRSDGFRALKAGKPMPGKLDWQVGYFPKLRIQQDQLEKQTFDNETRSFDAMRSKVKETSDRKLRETQVKKGNKKGRTELKKQRRIEYKEAEEGMLISAPPPHDYPSGILSIQIHQITGLELQNPNKDTKDDGDKEINNDESDDLPSSYCTIIINHAKAYKTRTKPKNARPFFNAGTERFIPDWRSTEVHISVRDSRVHEDDALLGIVHLPLSEVFKDRAQINSFYPLAGGVGFGRIRLSMVWRSVELQAPSEMLGWQIGTLQVSGIRAINLPEDLKSLNIKLGTNLSSAKLRSNGSWEPEHPARLAITDRYSNCLSLRFRSKGMTKSKTVAFAILWFRDIPDEEEREVELPVWRGNFQRAMKAEIEKCGEQAGSIKVKLIFWSGLGPKHKDWAVKHNNMRDVVQVLETTHDNLETTKAEREAGIIDEDDSDSDSSDDDSLGPDLEVTKDRIPMEENGKDAAKAGADTKSTSSVADANASTSNKQNPEQGEGKADQNPIKDFVEEVKDYKKNYKSIHRRNRGIMTWKAPRTAQWAFHKAEQTEHKLTGIFKRHSRGAAIETEV